MAKFASGGADAPKHTQGRGAGSDAGLSIIAVGMRVVGELATDGVIKVEGTVEGSIRADRQVLIAREGAVEGDVYTREAIVGGRVSGSVYADDRVEVQASSKVHGDIVTKRLIVQDGGEVNGHVRMGEPRALEQGAAVAAKRTASAPVIEPPAVVPQRYPHAASSP